MLIKLGLLGLSIALAGCANTYKTHPNEPAAELSMTTIVDGNASSTNRMTYLVALADGSCGHNPNGDNLGRDERFFSPSSLNIDSTQIAATSWLHFIAGYIEFRPAEELKCKVDGSFEPIAGKKYKGVLHIKNDVHSCDFTIVDAASGQNIHVEKPQYACPYVGYTGEQNFMELNGVGVDHLHSIPKVIVMPAPVK